VVAEMALKQRRGRKEEMMSQAVRPREGGSAVMPAERMAGDLSEAAAVSAVSAAATDSAEVKREEEQLKRQEQEQEQEEERLVGHKSTETESEKERKEGTTDRPNHQDGEGCCHTHHSTLRKKEGRLRQPRPKPTELSFALVGGRTSSRVDALGSESGRRVSEATGADWGCGAGRCQDLSETKTGTAATQGTLRWTLLRTLHVTSVRAEGGKKGVMP
jgi:hypothetical protein